MEAVVSPISREFVHHFVIIKDGIGGANLWAWVPGNGPYVLPEEAGIRLHQDGVTGASVLVMQTHFDNPAGKSGVLDQSGLDLYVTQTLRQHDAGMLSLGQVKAYMYGDPVEDRKYTFECSSSCTQTNEAALTVFGTMFHMHRTGSRYPP